MFALDAYMRKNQVGPHSVTMAFQFESYLYPTRLPEIYPSIHLIESFIKDLSCSVSNEVLSVNLKLFNKVSITFTSLKYTQPVNVHLAVNSRSRTYIAITFHSLSNALTPPLPSLNTGDVKSQCKRRRRLITWLSFPTESIFIPSSESLPARWARRSGAWERLGYIAAHRCIDLLLFSPFFFSSLTAQPTLVEMKLKLKSSKRRKERKRAMRGDKYWVAEGVDELANMRYRDMKWSAWEEEIKMTLLHSIKYPLNVPLLVCYIIYLVNV